MSSVKKVLQIGPATLILGDAYTIRPTLGWFDADVMDPPYVIRTSGGGSFRKHRPYLDKIQEEGLDRGFDHQIINPLLCGAAVVFCHNDQIPAVSATLDGLFHRMALCVWQKTTPMPVANKHYVPETEIYFHAWSRGYHPQGDLADLKRVFSCRSRALQDFDHPTVKPDALMDKIIRNVAGETVCDAFMGTGSTGVAALRAGKRFTGIEHNPAHFESACSRIRDAVEHAPTIPERNEETAV
ncbi:DNA methyltransferase [Novosphingobium sp.]|mgnify:FL=1|uniref:DNA methyltransferase n=1 Tax=Novosphingobium sp. TaxID=1874826 RepID=UPI001ED4D45A|nr:DNA methyltransferase [Novosphingobium sp.]MBK6801683.1 site-specific DNA-methyltransferase [Novosphingobium sp.]MBK9009949.1 site-specific DNA-methyltransferase [Novosphingobium sp.]